MIILDTNVLGALMRIAPEAPVVAWLSRGNDFSPVSTSSIRSRAVVVSVAEKTGMISSGVAQRDERKQTADDVSKAQGGAMLCKDGGRSFGAGRQGKAPNDRKLRRDGSQTRSFC